MIIRSVLRLSCVSVVFASAPASAQLPADQVIQWKFRQDPSDPNSAVEFHAVVTLTAWEVDANAVGWSVAKVEFLQPVGSEIKSWIEENPPLETPDGLWWVTHDDPLSPDLGEFLDTPLLKGRAFAEDPGDVDLLYELASQSAIGEGPFEQTSDVDYILAAADTEDHIKEGDNEMVDTEESDDFD